MSQDKQFDATPQRLRRARERGEVAHSRELTAAGILLLTMLAAPALTRGMAGTLLRGTTQALGHLHEPELTPAGLKALALHWGALLGFSLAPLLAATIAAALVLSLLQTGPLLTTHPLRPRFDRLNPAQALRRLFSWRGFAETLKSLLKLTIIALTAYLVLRRNGSELGGSGVYRAAGVGVGAEDRVDAADPGGGGLRLSALRAWPVTTHDPRGAAAGDTRFRG